MLMTEYKNNKENIEQNLYLSKIRTINLKRMDHNIKNKRLNIGLSLNQLQQKLDDKLIEYEYGLPKILIEYITKIIQINFSNIYISKKKTEQNRYKRYLDIALYLCSAIIYFNYKKDYSQGIFQLEYDTINGCELSRQILTNVVPTRDLYKIKSLLIETNIIGNVPQYTSLNLIDESTNNEQKYIFYSKDRHTALYYFINPKYLNNYQEIIYIKNKYCDKHKYLMKHGMLVGNKRKTLNNEYNPYDNIQKNKQYRYQKKMGIKQYDYKQIFLNYFKITDESIFKELDFCIQQNVITDNIKRYYNYKNMIRVYNTLINFNKHIFSAGQAYGRIFMPLHYLPSIFRSKIYYEEENNILKELFDIKCCFIQLAGYIALKGNMKIDQVIEYKRLIKLAKEDIYKDIIEKKLLRDIITRKEIKSRVMVWLFATKTQRKYAKDKIVNAINQYFKEYFPYFHKFICNYRTCKSDKLYKNHNNKFINKLSIDCFEFESRMMFEYVLKNLHNKFQDMKFISLHDGIWTDMNSLNKNKSIDFKIQIERQIQNYLME